MLTSARDLGVYVGAFLGAWPPRDGPETGPVRRVVAPRDAADPATRRAASVARDATGRCSSHAGGYGFGLGVSSNCNFAHIVAHSGGLPGFGSLMRGCRSMASASSRSATAPTPDGAGRSTAALTVLNEDRRARGRACRTRQALADAARAGVEADPRSGTTPRAIPRGAEPVPRPEHRSSACRHRGAAYAVGRVQAGEQVRLRRECTARTVDPPVRAWWPPGIGQLARPTMPPSVQFLEVTPAPPPEEVGRPALCQGS